MTTTNSMITEPADPAMGSKGLTAGRFTARLARNADEIAAAQRLRHESFIAARARGQDEDGGVDADALDAECLHLIVTEAGSDRLAACCRLLPLANGSEITRSYSAQHYDLRGLAGFEGPILEMGRFCLRPDLHDPQVVRLAWAELTRLVDARGIELLIGCSSFIGTEPGEYADAFAMLKERHLAPRRWLPRVKAPKVFRYARALGRRSPDPRRAMQLMPPLLRSYLAMGGWVSDHAVVDEQLGTLHVFTGLEIRAIPPARKRLLRAVAATAS